MDMRKKKNRKVREDQETRNILFQLMYQWRTGERWEKHSWEKNDCVLCNTFADKKTGKGNCDVCWNEILHLFGQPSERKLGGNYCVFMEFGGVRRGNLDLKTSKEKQLFADALVFEIEELLKRKKLEG